MKITIIYDNTAFRKDLRADWGFAALVETFGRKILFDTGANGAILLANMKTLGIAPQKIGDVFISHSHFDHTGGLPDFLDLNSDVTMWVPRCLRGNKTVAAVRAVDAPEKLYAGICSTGELAGIEQSLCVTTKKGVVVIVGCAHPPVAQILTAASAFGRVYGIIGGLHGNQPETLVSLDLICATHCTQHKQEIKSVYPEKYIEGGAGKIIEIADAALPRVRSRRLDNF